MKKWLPLITAAVMLAGGAPCNAAAPAPSSSDISAKASVLIDAQTGCIVWGKNENTALPMASTTKIMTTILTLESGDLDTEFTVDSTAVRTEGSSMGLKEGDIVSKRDLCIGMLLPSGNDAANCAAVKLSGSIEDFSELMNKKASELGLRSTHFITPSGLHDPDHYSTARDMAELTSYALKNPDFASICSQSSIKLAFGNPPYDRWLSNTNKLLKKYEYCIGVKTGFTDEAGRCLVSAARKDGVTLICVTLNAPDDWNDHIKLYNYGFSVTEAVKLETGSFSVKTVGGSREKISLAPEYTPLCTCINGISPEIKWQVICPPFVYAPVKSGDKLGELVLYSGEREIERIPLAAAESCAYIKGEPPKMSLRERIISFIREKLF